MRKDSAQDLTHGIFSRKISIYHFSKDEFLSISMLLQRDRFFWAAGSVIVNIYYFGIWTVLPTQPDGAPLGWFYQWAMIMGTGCEERNLRGHPGLTSHCTCLNTLETYLCYIKYYLASFLCYWINVFRKQKWRKSWELEAWTREMISSWRLHSYRVVRIVIYLAVEYY